MANGKTVNRPEIEGYFELLKWAQVDGKKLAELGASPDAIAKSASEFLKQTISWHTAERVLSYLNIKRKHTASRNGQKYRPGTNSVTAIVEQVEAIRSELGVARTPKFAALIAGLEAIKSAAESV